MSIFGQKCERCGKTRTKETYEGVPTCEPCEGLLKAKLQADAEDARICPVEGEKMKKEIVANIVIDRCPECQGVWLDHGELDLLSRVIEFGAAQDVMKGIVYPMY